MTGLYRLAELNIEVTSLHEAVHRLCSDYRLEDPGNGAADLCVETEPEDIAFERQRSEQEDHLGGIPIREFSDGYLETLAVYRKIAERLPERDRLLFHGSCVAVDGWGYLFTAASGTGKSTHARLWRELLGERAVMVNDDKPIIRIGGADGSAAAGSAGPESITIYGTPWDGKHRLSSNISAPLKAICILQRGTENVIRPVKNSEAWPMLLQQCYRPLDGEAMQKTLSLLDRLGASVRLWRLACNMDISAAKTAFEAMSGTRLPQ